MRYITFFLFISAFAFGITSSENENICKSSNGVALKITDNHYDCYCGVRRFHASIAKCEDGYIKRKKINIEDEISKEVVFFCKYIGANEKCTCKNGKFLYDVPYSGCEKDNSLICGKENGILASKYKGNKLCIKNIKANETNENCENVLDKYLKAYDLEKDSTKTETRTVAIGVRAKDYIFGDTKLTVFKNLDSKITGFKVINNENFQVEYKLKEHCEISKIETKEFIVDEKSCKNISSVRKILQEYRDYLSMKELLNTLTDYYKPKPDHFTIMGSFYNYEETTKLEKTLKLAKQKFNNYKKSNITFENIETYTDPAIDFESYCYEGNFIKYKTEINKPAHERKTYIKPAK